MVIFAARAVAKFYAANASQILKFSSRSAVEF
jgi:hypothetical protein